jgi:hypothetical protein
MIESNVLGSTSPTSKSVTDRTALGCAIDEVRAGSQALHFPSDEQEGGGAGTVRAIPFTPEPPEPQKRENDQKGLPLTRALRSHQLWLTITYFGLLVLIARGLAG